MTQLELIPLTTDQKHAAGLEVAKLTLQLGEIQAEHAAAIKAMREVERELIGRIGRLALAIRDGRAPSIEDL